MPNPVCAYCYRPALLAFVAKAQEGEPRPFLRRLCGLHVTESADAAGLSEQERADLDAQLGRLAHA